MQLFNFVEGTAPLLISMPHCGTQLAPEMAENITPAAKQLADTDWHLQKLYDFAKAMGASIIQPHYSRYVIDLNRPADNTDLYPGANGTELCPTSSFAEEPLYQPGKEPNSTEVSHRLQTYWHPYHGKLQEELTHLRARHGVAVLFEAHSIRSEVPRFFEGRLPDINIGTANGTSCAPQLLTAVEKVLKQQKDYSFVVNQRFKGGYITRAYGQPVADIHALQLELSQRTYMEETFPFNYSPKTAKQVQPVLSQLIAALIEWAEQRSEHT